MASTSPACHATPRTVGSSILIGVALDEQAWAISLYRTLALPADRGPDDPPDTVLTKTVETIDESGAFDLLAMRGMMAT